MGRQVGRQAQQTMGCGHRATAAAAAVADALALLAGSERVQRARRWWGPNVTEPLLGTSSSQEKTGLTEFGDERALAHAEIAFVALEFGTLGPPHGETALRDDAWLWRHGNPRALADPTTQRIRRALLDYFYPPHDDWKEAVLWRSRQVYRQALEGLAGGAAH